MIGAPRVPAHRRRIAGRLERCIDDNLAALMSARLRDDDLGRYVWGFGSLALRVRAAGKHEPETRPWFETEGAKLIYQVLVDDWRGARTLADHESVTDPSVETEIIERAKAKIPFWIAKLPKDWR